MTGLNHECVLEDLAAYLDGELDASREIDVETHLGICRECSVALNGQKQLLRSLEASLRDDHELQLPRDFTKHLVVRAESSVTGVRRPAEFFNAVLICAAMGLFVLFATGPDADRLLSVVEQITAVAAFFGHMIYSFFVGVAIIVRATAAQLDGGTSTAIFLTLAAGACGLYVSRKALTARGI